MRIKIDDMHYCDCVTMWTNHDENSCDILFTSVEQMQDFIREACKNGVRTIPAGEVMVTAYYDSLECM